MSTRYGQAMFNSCKDVVYSAANQRAMMYVGGGATSYQQLLDFVGTVKDERVPPVGSPYQLTFPPGAPNARALRPPDTCACHRPFHVGHPAPGNADQPTCTHRSLACLQPVWGGVRHAQHRAPAVIHPKSRRTLRRVCTLVPRRGHAQGNAGAGRFRAQLLGHRVQVQLRGLPRLPRLQAGACPRGCGWVLVCGLEAGWRAGRLGTGAQPRAQLALLARSRLSSSPLPHTLLPVSPPC